jgi:thermitase
MTPVVIKDRPATVDTARVLSRSAWTTATSYGITVAYCASFTKENQEMGRTVLAFLTLIAAFALTCAAALAQDVQLVAPAPGKIKPKAARPITWTPDTLLISPAADATSDDISTAMKEVKGKVVKTIGEGPLTVLVVQLEKGQLDKAETKLRKDKHFADITRDFHFTVDAAASQPVNDPYFPSQWHLGAINAVRAWQVSNGGSSILAVLDTGTNGSIADLAGKTYSGFDAVNNRDGQQDVHGHGTMVATTAAANTNNGTATAAPARLSRIYPVRIGSGSGISMQAILNGIYKCGNSGIKIINISANGSAPYTFANRSFTTLHNYMKWFHDTKGGLIFNSAGNDARFDSNPMVPYLIVVSAIDTSYSLVHRSRYQHLLQRSRRSSGCRFWHVFLQPARRLGGRLHLGRQPEPDECAGGKHFEINLLQSRHS